MKMAHCEETSHLCHCDPLKVILKSILKNFAKTSNKSLADVEDIHFFYKTSVIRSKAPDTKTIKFTILHETIKILNEWVQLCNADPSSRINVSQLPDIMKFTFDSQTEKYLTQTIQLDQFGNVGVELNAHPLTGDVIRWLIDNKDANNTCHETQLHISVAVNSPSSKMNSWSHFRKTLTAQMISTVVRKAGHQVDEGHYNNVSNDKIGHNHIFVVASTCQSGIDDDVSDLERSNVATVFSLTLGNIVAQHSSDLLTFDELFNARLAKMKDISESRRSESLAMSCWSASVSNLTTVTIHFDIISKSLKSDVSFPTLDKNHANHDGLFVMYNYSRILSILRKFDDEVNTGVYPALPAIMDVDFSSICQRREDLHLVQLLLEWPRILDSCVNFKRFETNLHLLPKYLVALAKSFNTFYFEIVVLVPTNAIHNFPSMMARIYLMKALRVVFEHGLDIMQISHINSSHPSSKE